MKSALPRFARTPLTAAAAGLFVTSVAFADSPAPFTIDSVDTSQVGLGFYESESVTRSASGSFLVAWSQYSTNGTSTTVNLRFYNADGTPQGNVTSVTVDGYYASLAMDKAGDFAIASYTGVNNGILGDGEVMIQRYAADGSAQGSAIDVGAISNHSFNLNVFGKYVYSTQPMLAMDDDGDIAVAWTTQTSSNWRPYGSYFGNYTGESDSSKTYAAIYKTDGTTLVAKKVVESVFPRTQKYVSGWGNEDSLNGLAMDGNGDLVLSFSSQRDTTTQTAVLGLSKNLKITHKFTDLADPKKLAHLGIDGNGNFDIEWTDPADNSLHVSQYNSSAALVDSIGPVETPPDTMSATEVPTLSVAPSGNFAVTWGTYDADTFNFQKNGEFFNADGTPNGSPFVIGAVAGDSNNEDAATAFDDSGTLVTIWTTYLSDGVTEDLVGQLASAP